MSSVIQVLALGVFLIIFAALSIVFCCSCSSQTKDQEIKAAKSSTFDSSVSPASAPSLASAFAEAVEKTAEEADQTVVDGWYFGRDSRLLKSYYRKIPSKTKAEFALAYRELVAQSGQDMVKDFKSYLPYSKRADFAYKWWQEHSKQFGAEELKMQVLWVHESVQDASELCWRARARTEAGKLDSMQALAHDEEQRMVSQFMEQEGAPSSISEQIFQRKQRLAAKNRPE